MKRKTYKNWSKLSKLLIGMALVITTYSIYAVVQSSTGPLGFIANKLSINTVKCVTQKDEESVCTDSATGKTTVTTYEDGFRSNITTTTTRTDMTDARNGDGPAIKIKVIKEDIIDKGNIVSTTNTIKETKVDKTGKELIGETNVVTRTLEFKPGTKNPEDGNVSGLSNQIASTKISSKTIDATDSTISQQSGTINSSGNSSGGVGGGQCDTNGSPVLEGTWVSTGHANTDVRDGVTGRQCVKCGAKGYEGNMDCRDVVSQGLPIVLPTGGGVNYTGTKESISSCFADIGGGAWTQIAVGQQTKKNDKDVYCSPTGNLVEDKATLTEEMKSMCSAIGKEASDGKCVDKPKTPPPSTEPTNEEIQAKKDECRGNSKEYDATKNECGQKNLKCGPGYTERAGFCDLAPGSTSEIIRENIKTSGEKFCKEQDKKFDPSTGLCQDPTAGRPRECDPKKMYSQGAKEGYRFCEFDSSNKVIGEKYVFCDTSTSTYDSKKGSCVSNKYPNAGNECGSSPAIKDVNGTWIGTPSCGQSCGGLGSYPKDGKLYCNSPSAPTVSVRPDPTKITNQNGIVGAYANDPGECKYGNGAIKETNGKYACPTDTLANPVLDSIPTPITPPENNPTVQVRLQEMADKIKASGKCTDSIIDVGIRIVCDPNTKEPTFDFCDGGNGRFDNNGKCIPVSANDDSLNAPSLVKSAGVGALLGAGAGALFCGGAGLLTGGIAIPLIPACLVSVGTVTTTIGTAIGYGVAVVNTPQKINNEVTFPNGKVGVHANSPAECKYGNLAVEDPQYGDWICPTENEGATNMAPTIEDPIQPVSATQVSHTVGGASAGVGVCAAAAILAAPFTGLVSLPIGTLICGGMGLAGGIIGYNIP